MDKEQIDARFKELNLKHDALLQSHTDAINDKSIDPTGKTDLEFQIKELQLSTEIYSLALVLDKWEFAEMIMNETKHLETLILMRVRSLIYPNRLFTETLLVTQSP